MNNGRTRVQVGEAWLDLRFSKPGNLKFDPEPCLNLIGRVLLDSDIPAEFWGNIQYEGQCKAPRRRKTPLVEVLPHKHGQYKFFVLPHGWEVDRRQAFKVRVEDPKFLDVEKALVAIATQLGFSGDCMTDIPQPPALPGATVSGLTGQGLRLKPVEEGAAKPEEPTVYVRIKLGLSELVTDEGCFVTDATLRRFVTGEGLATSEEYDDAIRVLLGRKVVEMRQRHEVHYRLTEMNGLDELSEIEAQFAKELAQCLRQHGGRFNHVSRSEFAGRLNRPNNYIDQLLSQLKKKGYIVKNEEEGTYAIMKESAVIYPGRLLINGVTHRIVMHGEVIGEEPEEGGAPPPPPAEGEDGATDGSTVEFLEVPGEPAPKDDAYTMAEQLVQVLGNGLEHAETYERLCIAQRGVEGAETILDQLADEERELERQRERIDRQLADVRARRDETANNRDQTMELIRQLDDVLKGERVFDDPRYKRYFMALELLKQLG